MNERVAMLEALSPCQGLTEGRLQGCSLREAVVALQAALERQAQRLGGPGCVGLGDAG
jgi:hypothetical protein